MAAPAPLRRSLLQTLVEGIACVTDPAAPRALREALKAFEADDLILALRIVDRAWRKFAADAQSIAPVYGHLLFLDGREYGAALTMLQRSLESAPDPNIAALCALALLNLQRPAEARGQVEAALGSYCVTPDGLLAFAASEIAAHAAMAPGWVARGPDLRVVGELLGAPGALEVRAGTSVLKPAVRGTRSGARSSFTFAVTKAEVLARLQVRCGGKALLGSGQAVPQDFGLDGRAGGSGDLISGWARLGWDPRSTVPLRLEDETGRTTLLEANTAQAAHRWGFIPSLKKTGLHGARITVCARLPDARWQPLPDSPVLLEAAVRLPKQRAKQKPKRRPVQHARGVDIIIPVYRGLAESLACIDSVVATLKGAARKGAARIIVIDDATEDAALAAGLDARAASGRIELLRNKTNLGFVASVNRGMARHPTRDVVLLNADTLVFGDWLERLRKAAYARADIGTVTPFSNNATIASYPQALGGALDPKETAGLQALAAAALDGVGADLPVGVGSCLYLRRDCLTEVGPLDADVFGKGYGEETDFCLRARRLGWTHRLAADVYVWHAGGSSFGAQRAALLERAQRLINLRHPGYDRFIADFLAQDPLRPLRRRLDERRLGTRPGPFVLLVTLSLPGGVDRYVAERSQQLRKWGLHPLVLRPVEIGNMKRCELTSEGHELPNLRFEVPSQLPELVALLGSLNLKGIEVQHFLGLDPRVIEAIRRMGVPYDVMVHDYAWICPRVTLVDGNHRYCGEPAVKVCETCVRRHGTSLDEKISVQALRLRSAKWLKGARRVLAPSADAAARLGRHFKDLEVVVQPHAQPYTPVPRKPERLPDRPLRVALLGAVGHHKGYQVLLECARNARKRGLPLEFVVIGFTLNDAPLLATGRVFVTGRYEDSEVPHLLEREQPDLGWLPSVWPETWCYALDHLLRTGLPLVSFDIGALAERLRSVAHAELLPLELAPGRINDRLLQLAHTPQVLERVF